MALNLTMSDSAELKPRITVFGVGGAGGNSVNNMIDKQLDGVEFVVANTDSQALAQSKAAARIQIGAKVTEGLGAGARPAVGAAAAEESIEEIIDHLAGAHMCFITAGMGGGTGTGAAPIIAQAARELGVLTVGVVTKPFMFEGPKRMRQAEAGIEAMQKVVDTLIIIPNQNLFRLANEKTTSVEAFAMADDVLYQGVKGVTDLMVRPGLINLDFADVRAVMDEMGKAMMGTGEASGEDRAIHAAEKAIANPLLDEISLNGAKGVLINITGSYDVTLFELDEAANIIREKVDPDANIIVGSTLDTTMEGTIRVSVVATGIDAAPAAVETPVTRRTLAEPLRGGAEVAAEPTRAEPAAPAAETVARAAAVQPASPSIERAQLGLGRPAAETRTTEATIPEPRMNERSLFADDPNDGLFGEDDVPPPAYRPQPQPQAQQPAPRAELPRNLPDAADFVAPRPRAAGVPSPETLARLRAAVEKAPQRGPMMAPQSQPQPSVARAAPEKPRFGINSLLNRMTGHHPEADRGATQAARHQPPVTAYDDEPATDPEQDRIEIPAFLRRQAN